MFREDRRGWFISLQPLIYDLLIRQSFQPWRWHKGRTPRSELLSAELIQTQQASGTITTHHRTDDELYRIKRLRYLDNRPVVVVTNYILPIISFQTYWKPILLNLSVLYCLP